MNVKTAFVASALPARFLLDNFLSLKITRLICGSKELKESFQFLKEKFPELEILSMSSIAEDKKASFLLDEVEVSKSSIVIFHECCWLDLDVAILKVQPVVEYFPSVTLDGWRKLSLGELSFSNLLLRLIVEKNKNILRLIFLSIRYKTSFDFYEVEQDDGEVNNTFETALKESKVIHLKKSQKCLESRALSKKISPELHSKNIAFIIARDVIEDKLQIEMFLKIINICKSFGYDILIKDHPNPINRLNLKEVGDEISPLSPFEIFEEPYFIKIGLFSTVLAFDPKNSISIANLFIPAPLGFKERRQHLLSIPGGDQIKFINNLDDITNLLELNLKQTDIVKE